MPFPSPSILSKTMPKYYWYYVTLQANETHNSVETTIIRSVYFQFMSQKITRNDMNAEMKRKNFNPKTTAVMNNMYLGHMTEEEFQNE